ncbi:MAG: beta-N-acetylglucosaminidase domain-containing protein [Armatimonadota bacterium]|nr:beta-N-acetylglucosaminidase domain-containing protein [Armatimonadota bacterium]
MPSAIRSRLVPAAIIVALLLACAAIRAAGPPVALLANGGFEHGDWEWRSMWGHAGHRVVDDRTHSGRRCMHFSSPGAILSRRYRYDGGPIEVSGWYRLQDVVTGDRPYWNWWISVNFIDAEGENIRHFDALHGEGTNDWRPFRWRVEAAPEGTARIELSVSLHNCSGQAWVDDLQMTAAGGLDWPAWRYTDQPYYTGRILPRPRQVSYGRTVPIWDARRREPTLSLRLGDDPCGGAQLGAELLDFRLNASSRHPRFTDASGPEPTDVIVDLGLLDDAHVQRSARLMGVELPDLPPQGHVVRMRDSGDSVRVLAAGADDMGCAFAAASIMQMIGFEDERLVLRTFEMVDWPELRWRISSDYGPVSERFLRRMVSWKMSMYGIQHRAWWRLVGPEGGPAYGRERGWEEPLRVMREFAERTGAIDYMMVMHIYTSSGRPPERTGPVFDIASEEDVSDLIDRLRWVYERGVHTFMIGVDDYVSVQDGQYQFKTEAEAERFDSVGQSHGYLMRRLWEALSPDCPELRLSIVAGPYSLAHLQRHVTEEAGRRYLNDMAEAMPDEVAVVWTGPQITSPTITPADWRAYQALVPGQPLYLWDNMQSGRPVPLYDVRYYRGMLDDCAWSLLYQNSHFVGWPNTIPAAMSANDYMWNPSGYQAEQVHRLACRAAWGDITYEDIRTVNEGYVRARELLRGGQEAELVASVEEIYAAIERLEADGVPMALPRRQLSAAGATPEIRSRLAAIPSATVPRVQEAPAIDGRLDDPIWENAATLPALVRHDTGEPLGEYFPTDVLLAHDTEALYVACRCHHEGVELHGHENQGRRDASIFFNSDTIELFLGRTPGEPAYVHLAVDHTNTQYDERRPTGGVNWDAAWQSAVTKQVGVWTLEVAVPFEELGASDRAGETWRANICRSFGQQGQLSCWAPTWGSFHNWPFFGRLTFAAGSQ